MKLGANKISLFLVYYSIGLIIVYIFIHVFIYDVFTIPSNSMEETIKAGDRVLINKFRYGPRLPVSPKEIPFFNLFFCLSKKYRNELDSVRWDYFRPFRIFKIEHNHIIVFNYPINPNQILIKRCVGLPGDTILISNKTILINSTEFKNNSSFIKGRNVLFQDKVESSMVQKEEHYNYNQIITKNTSPISNSNDYAKPIDESENLDHNKINTSIIKPMIFPNDDRIAWDFDNFGPLIIPCSGYTIQLTMRNYILYSYVINHFENSRITYLNSEFYINGEKNLLYTFKNNYYIALGDNPNSSIDSRHWGFIPENFIIGKASIVLYAYDNLKLKYNRFFKLIK